MTALPVVGAVTAHDCVKRINAMLADKNTEISTAISFGTPERELIQIATNKAHSDQRGKPVKFFASYCPFCGVKLHKDEQGTPS